MKDNFEASRKVASAIAHLEVLRRSIPAKVEAIKKSKAFYKKFRKAYKTIPPFYRELGDEAALAYFRRITSKRSTAHWHLDFGGIRFWFWRIWEDECGNTFDSKTQVSSCLPLWKKRGIALYNLRFYSFNKPKEATK